MLRQSWIYLSLRLPPVSLSRHQLAAARPHCEHQVTQYTLSSSGQQCQWQVAGLVCAFSAQVSCLLQHSACPPLHCSTNNCFSHTCRVPAAAAAFCMGDFVTRRHVRSQQEWCDGQRPLLITKGNPNTAEHRWQLLLNKLGAQHIGILFPNYGCVTD